MMLSEAWLGLGWEGVGSNHFPRSTAASQTLLADSNCFISFFSLPFLANIKPPDVTCIPKVRSIQMNVHPPYTVIRARNGHQLTLENIFQDLRYHFNLRINHTYQMVNEG